MVASAWRSHGHAEGSVAAGRAVVDRDGTVKTPAAAIGMRFGRQAACTGGVEDGMGRTVAPS